jgi:hypothetical protein
MMVLTVGIYIRLAKLIVRVINNVDIELVVSLPTLQNDSSVSFVLHMVFEELVEVGTECTIGWL